MHLRGKIGNIATKGTNVDYFKPNSSEDQCICGPAQVTQQKVLWSLELEQPTALITIVSLNYLLVIGAIHRIAKQVNG